MNFNLPYNTNEQLKIININPIKKDMYIISDYGRIFNMISGKELSQINCNGYMSVALQNKDNSRSTYYIHRLVAIMFIPKTQEDILLERDFVNHKDRCKSNNYKYNLEWTTNQENITHALNTSLEYHKAIMRESENHWSDGAYSKGERNGMARLSDNQVHIICKSLEQGKSYKEAAINAGLRGNENDMFLISHIVQGHRRKDISSQYNLNQKYTMTNFDDYIIPVCELLEKQKSTTEIINILNMDNSYKSRSFINRIKRKATYTNISQNYNF